MEMDRKRLWARTASALAIGICLMILLMGPLKAAAAENEEVVLPDLERKGSISIDFREWGTGKPFSFDAKVGLFKVAEISLEDGLHFVYDELFESVGDAPTLASELNAELADRLEETAEFKGISYDAPSEAISESGNATFQNLTPGLYLIIQTQRGTDSPKYQIPAFLVTIPIQNSEGAFEYDVKMLFTSGKEGPGSAALVEEGATMIDTTSVEVKKEEKKNWLPVVIFCLVGAVVVIGVIGSRKK